MVLILMLLVILSQYQYKELKNQGFKILGIFGREDYANIWKDFYNGEINKDQLNKFLDSK